MLKKRNFIFLSLLILGILLFTSCLPNPPVLAIFDSQGGSAIEAQTVDHGELVIEPADPTKAGFTFGGWYKEAGCINPWDFDIDTVTDDITLYAKWTTKTYTVTFNSQSGSAVSSQMVEHGDLVSEPSDPTREGYTFEGWYKQSSCINAWDFANDTVTSNITLYAKWTAKSYTVSLSVNPVGSGTTTGSGTYHKGDLVSITAIAKSGYIFINWTDDDDAGGPVSMDNPYTFIMIARDINCTANFQKQNGKITIDGKVFYIEWVVDGDIKCIPFQHIDGIVVEYDYQVLETCCISQD